MPAADRAGTETSDRIPTGRHGWHGLGLALLAFVARLIMARQHPVICTDAVFYLERAAAWRRGDVDFALSRLGLNPFPWLIAQLHAWGLDWELAGTSLSLVAASLAVIPLWALTGHLLGPRVALIAALLYAVHPELIEWSPEIIRDPLYWLLFASSLYLMHRACQSAALGWFLAAGGTTALAVLTRFEGWFLLIPLAAWATLAGHRQPTLRWPLTRGSAACLAILPLLILAINATTLRAHHRWEWGRLDHVAMAIDWLSSTQPTLAPAVHTPHASEEPTLASSWNLRGAVWGFSHTWRRGFREPYFWGALVGLILLKRQRRGQDSAPLVVLGGVQLLAVWIYFWQQHEINARYVLPVLLLALPCVALTLDTLSDVLGKRLKTWAPRHARYGVAACLLIILFSLGLTEAWTRQFDGRYVKAHLGAYLQNRFGPGRTVLCSENLERLVGYYAAAHHSALPAGHGGQTLVETVRDCQPDVVALWLRAPGPQLYAEMLDASSQLGYRTLPRDELPACCDEVCVLVRRDFATEPNRSVAMLARIACDCANQVVVPTPHR